MQPAMNEPMESGLVDRVRRRAGLTGKPAWPHIVLWIALAVALVVAAADLPSRWAEFERIIPLVQQWSDPEEQYRIETADLPYPHDLLRQADAILPRHASVLLVTPSKDVERIEYITFNRALYLLAPRSVWWASPGASDGSWKSRWRISTALTGEAIGAVARDTHAQYLLAYDLSPDLNLNIGRKVAQWPDGYLLLLDEAAASEAPRAYQQFAGSLWPLQLLPGVATILALGWLVVQATWRLDKPLRFGRLEAIALAWPLGAGVASVLMLWLNWLGLHLGWQVAAITLLIVGLVGITLRRMRQSDDRALFDHRTTVASLGFRRFGQVRRSAPRMLFQALLVPVLTFQIFIVTVSAVGRPLTVWDSWANWAIKARIVFLDSYISPSVYADSSRAITQLDYPLLQPLVESWLFKWLGAPDDRFAGVVSVLFFLSLLALCYYAVRYQGGGRTLGLAVCTVVATIWEIGTLVGIVFTEVPLILFATITGLYLYRWLREGSRGALLAAAIAAGLMPWTKREGTVLLVALCAGLLLTNLTVRRAWVGVGGMALGALVLAGPWWLFIAAHGIVNPAFSPISLGTLTQNIGRWPAIWGVEVNSLLSSLFSYIWPLAAIAGPLMWLTNRKRRGLRLAAFLPVAAMLYALLTGFIYIFSDFVPYEEHVLSSIDRLLAEVVPLFVLWLVFLAYPVGTELAPGVQLEQERTEVPLLLEMPAQ